VKFIKYNSLMRNLWRAEIAELPQVSATLLALAISQPAVPVVAAAALVMAGIAELVVRNIDTAAAASGEYSQT
jgi:hypothetical protein